MIEIGQNDDERKDEQVEGLGLEMEEEPIAMVEPKQGSEEAVRRQKTHAVLSDPQLVKLIGVKKKSSLEALGLKSDTVDVSLLGNLRVSLFWEEKIMLFLHVMQLLGFYYVAYREEVPDKYSNLHNFFAAFIVKVDFIGWYPDAIVEEKYSTMALYAGIWSCACLLVFVGIFFLYATGYFQRASISGPHFLFKYGYYLFELAAFPILMNTVPTAACQYSSNKVGITVCDCWRDHNEQIIVLALAALSGAAILAIAISVAVIAQQNYVHDSNESHETYIQMKELEYVFDLSYIWQANWFFLFSSFKRERLNLYHRTIYYIFIITLTMLYSLLVLPLDNHPSL